MKHGGSGSQRWLVSYADMVTLLFALFLVLFAVSSVDNTRLLDLADALDMRLKQQEMVMQKEQTGLNLPPRNAAVTRPKDPTVKTLSHLESRLSGYDVRRTDQGVSVCLSSDGILFDSGQAELKPRSAYVLKELSEVLKDSQMVVRIEGHTDSQPISTARFQSNWELSVMRAWAVARYFLGNGVSPDRVSVMGYGSHHPVAPNTTARGRASNRRVVIHFSLASEPSASPTMPLKEEKEEQHGPRVTTEHRGGSVSVWTADTVDLDPDSGGADDSGTDHFVHSDNRGLGPYTTGSGNPQHSSQHRANTVGPLSHSTFHGFDLRQGLR